MCEGDFIFLQCLSGLDSYAWNTGESTNVISISSSGIYSVIATDANGCELNDAIEINSIEPIQVDIQTEMDSLIVCKGSEFSFNIASTFSSAVWNESFSALLYTGTASSLGDNIISVLAQDENGCYSNDSVILKVVDCTSVEEYLANTTLYPNPTTGEFIIQHQSINNDIQRIKVVDLQGRLIEQRKVDYINGIIQIDSVGITSVSNVDGSTSTRFRVTVLPDSNDVIPVRNQLLEIDTINTVVVGTIDQTATTGKGYTVTTTGGSTGGSTTGTTTTTTTTVATTSSTATSSSY